MLAQDRNDNPAVADTPSATWHHCRTRDLTGVKGGSRRLPPSMCAPILPVVSEAEAAAIRTTFEQEGEFSAAVELRRLFPLITDMAEARECARTIADWKPLPTTPRPIRRLRPRNCRSGF
jgi:hypothetical protein